MLKMLEWEKTKDLQWSLLAENKNKNAEKSLEVIFI